jgi:hypothetical protein
MVVTTTLDGLEYVIALEERFYIEICDEDFLNFDPGEDAATESRRLVAVGFPRS